MAKEDNGNKQQLQMQPMNGGLSMLSTKCVECGVGFQLCNNSISNAAMIHHKVKYEVNGQSIFLTYYDCPKCGRRHFAQIDTNKTLTELKSVERQFVEMAAAKTQGKKIRRKQTEKFTRSRQYLTVLRNDLMKRYTGAVVADPETGAEYELRFTV